MISERFQKKTFYRRATPWDVARRLAIVGLVLVWSAGCASSKPMPAPPSSGYSAYRVGAPDVLVINILPDPRIEREVVVRPDGMISVDLVGDVPAGGRTAEEIAADVQKRIARFKRGATVTVAVNRALSSSVTILGEVGGTRSLSLLREMRVAEAIGLAGGVNRFGNADSVRVVRPSSGETAVYAVNLEAIQAGDLSTNLLLHGGDIVYIPPTFWARIGHVINSILYPLQPFLGFGTSLAGSAATAGLGI